MALWDRVLSGFDLDNETVNFGTRKVAESDGSLYEVCTVATIRSSEQVKQKPNVSALVQNSMPFVAIDKSITIFQDETCASVFHNVSFPCFIACYCVSEDGLFLFVVFTNRTLGCFHMLKKKLLSTASIPGNQTHQPDDIIEIFFKEQAGEVFLILVSDTGAIYRFSFKTAPPNDEEDAVVAERTIDMRCARLFKGFTSPRFLNAIMCTLSEELSIIMIGADSIFTWPNEQCNCFNRVLSFGYKKIKPLAGSGKLLCLRTDLALSIVCIDTLLELKICDGPVFDFTIMECDVDRCEILFLIQSNNSDTAYTLRHISYPDFKEKLEIDVPLTIYLFENLPASIDILYMEGVIDKNGVIDTFRVKTISESIPDMHLARLLRKRRFDEAEALAKKLALSMETIYYSKAALFVQQLSPWAKSTSYSVNMDELINILDKIENVQYVTECCSKALVSDYVQMKRLYLYAERRIMQNIERGDTSERLNRNKSLISDTLHRFETFRMIQSIETDASLRDDVSMKEWIKFSKVNLLQEYNVYLSTGQLKAATLIWTRHLPNVIKDVSLQTVRDIFLNLPEDMAPSYLWPWLIHFIPTLLSFLPDAMDEIVSWSLTKLRHLETACRTEWPKIGMDFVEKFIKLLKFDDNQHSYFHKWYKCQSSVLRQFMLLTRALSDLQQLKIAYRLRVPFDMYIDSSKTVVHVLLDKVHLDNITDFVNKFLRQYMRNNNLENDEVFCTYIQKVIKNSPPTWIVEEVTWERRIAILVGFIQDSNIRVKQAYQVLKKAPVPWSSTMIALAEANVDSDHNGHIKFQYECNPSKVIFKKYRLPMDVYQIPQVISRVIKEDHDSMINDLDVITGRSQGLKQEAFRLCLITQLRKGNLQKALDVMHYLENNVTDNSPAGKSETYNICYSYEEVINYIVAVFSFQSNIAFSAHYMEMLGYLEFKIRNLLARSKAWLFRCNNMIDAITDLKSLCALKKDYKIDISLKDYRTRKTLVLQNCVTKLLPDIEQKNLLMIHKTIIKIAELLGLEKSYATLCLLKRMKNIDALREIFGDIKDLTWRDVAPSEFKDINKICLSALQQAAVNVNAMEMIGNLNISILSTCRDSALQSALLLNTCVSICPNLSIRCHAKDETVSPSNWKLYTIYKDHAISPDKELLSLFKNAVSFHLYYSDWIDTSDVTSYNDEEMNQLLINFLASTKEMQFRHNDYSLLRIFEAFYYLYCTTFVRKENTLVEMRSILSQHLTNLLRKLCIARSLDLHLTLGSLFMLPEQEACTWISTVATSFRADHIRHSTISILGYEYAYLAKNRSLMQTFERYKLLHNWAQRLSHYSIAYKEVLVNNTSTKREILQQIISSNKENIISVLKDYCYTFGFNFNDCLLLYLQIILKTWDPILIFSNSLTHTEVRIAEDGVDELRKKCKAIIAQMEDKRTLVQCITALWDQINFYHYEVFVILLDLIEEQIIYDKKRVCGETNYTITEICNGDSTILRDERVTRDYLCFLQNYTRKGPSTSMEYDKWIQLDPGHNALPPIAQWRFPFLPKMNIWKFLTPELSLNTYRTWLDIAPILKLETHLICSLAIKGAITRVWESNSIKPKDATWSLYRENTELLCNIKKCIQYITDSNEFYYGTAALYYVVNHTPLGVDRVAAARECYKYAQMAIEKGTKFDEGMLEKIKSKYLRYTSEHILRTHGLETSKYLALIENPRKLMYELYNDESVVSRYRSATNYRPDINKAVEEFGELFSLNTIKFRLELLQEWLHFNSAKYFEFSESDTMETLPILKESDRSADFEDNLLRTCYVLEYGDTNLFAQFLTSIGFGVNDDEIEYTYEERYRALRLLQIIVDTATLEKLTKRDANTFSKYITSLRYVGKLESLGLCYNVDTFESCSKRELVQILWENQSHSPHVLSIIAQICIQFEIYDFLFWNNVLNCMAKLRMVNELKRVLLRVRSNGIIVNCDGCKMGWQFVISEPFREMDVTPNSVQINNCVDAICLLYSCPVTHELDFTAIVSNCFQRKQAHLAAALLPYLNEFEKKFVLKTIHEKYQIAKLTEDLNNLSSKGVLTTAHSLAIMQKTVP